MRKRVKITKIPLLNNQAIRRVWHKREWWYSVVDIIQLLTDSARPRHYWFYLKSSLMKMEPVSHYLHKITALKLKARDGKMRETDCAQMKTLFRIIQSISTEKAEPIKQWLAQMAYERAQEMDDPELAMHRIHDMYVLKGYPKAWIEKRLHSIQIREALTEEWQQRQIGDAESYRKLTNALCQAIFGITPAEYKVLKGLPKESRLRDHMTESELVFMLLGEVAALEITRVKNTQGLRGSLEAAQLGGHVAQVAREALEASMGKKVISASHIR